MPRGKSPGKDGFPVEFYTWGWDFVKDLLMRTISEIWRLGTMGKELNEGLIVLLAKTNSHLSIST